MTWTSIVKFTCCKFRLAWLSKTYDINSIPTRSQRKSYGRRNCLRTAVVRFRVTTHRLGLTSSSKCNCEAKERTPGQALQTLPIYRSRNGVRGLTNSDEDSITALLNACPELQHRSIPRFGMVKPWHSTLSLEENEETSSAHKTTVAIRSQKCTDYSKT